MYSDEDDQPVDKPDVPTLQEKTDTYKSECVPQQPKATSFTFS
jgi:hypothetical protein